MSFDEDSEFENYSLSKEEKERKRGRKEGEKVGRKEEKENRKDKQMPNCSLEIIKVCFLRHEVCQ